MSSSPFSRVSLLGLLVLVGALGLHASTFIQGVYASPDTNLLVFAEASSFARLDDIDPNGWFYQAVLYNPTDSDIVATGLRWWYNTSVGVDFIDGVRNARCYDSRYFSNLPTVWVSGADDRTRWEYANGTISIIVPAKEIIVTWIEVPTNSRNNQDIPTTYYVEACVGSQWISSPLYVSHSGHDKIASTVFRADFNLTTDPNDEKQNTTQHNLQTPEWLFNEDRSVIANSSTLARVIPVTSSRNTDGIDYATINVTLPSGWSYVPGSAYNPYGETISFYSVDGKDRLKWDLDNNVYRYSDNQSMGQNYIEFNVTAPHVPGIHNFTVTSTITSSLELWTTTENQYIYAVVKTILNRAPVALFVIVPQQPIAGETIIFNASDSYDLDGIILIYMWNFGDGNITAVTSPTVTHTYKTFGKYSVILNVTDNDNFYNSSTLTLTVLNVDVAMVNIIVSATEVYVGQTVNISVVIRNEGTANETFNVTLYYDSHAIGTQTVTDLESGTETTLKFSWDTTGVTPDVSYSIKAETSGVSGETDTDDNTYTYDNVRVKSHVTSPPFDWSPILPYLIPILLGGLVFLVVGISRKKREVGLGFEFFNEMIAGVIPDAYSVMIIGGAGSGKSVLCQQLAYDYLTQGKSCVYITYDIFPFEVRQNMENFGWDISTYGLEGTFKFVDSYSGIAGLDSKEKYYVEQPFSLSDLGITTSAAIDDIKHKSIRVFLDSTAPLFARVDPSKVTEFLQDRSARIKGDNGAFFFTVGEGTVPSDLRRRLEEIVDCIIELDVYDEKGKTWKRIRVKKLRGRRVANAWIPFKIEMKKGINFFPPKDWIKSRKS